MRGFLRARKAILPLSPEPCRKKNAALGINLLCCPQQRIFIMNANGTYFCKEFPRRSLMIFPAWAQALKQGQ